MLRSTRWMRSMAWSPHWRTRKKHRLNRYIGDELLLPRSPVRCSDTLITLGAAATGTFFAIFLRCRTHSFFPCRFRKTQSSEVFGSDFPIQGNNESSEPSIPLYNFVLQDSRHGALLKYLIIMKLYGLPQIRAMTLLMICVCV
jgi:hypothetical protein